MKNKTVTQEYHSHAGSDLGVWEDLGELLDDTEGVRLALRIEAPISSALKCCSGSKLVPLS